MTTNVNVTLDDETNEMLEDFKSKTRCNKTDALRKLIKLGYKAYLEIKKGG